MKENKVSSIEFLRFFAALMVLLWHYQHFYLPYNFFFEINIFDNIESNQPFYNYLFLFYKYGYRGVDLFFIISGYVFSYVYINDSKENISLKSFFLFRFARLYPLHFLTLFLIMLLQSYSLNLYNDYVIYNNNDLKHFILNFFFISGWGFEKGPSFNGPVWTVSIEIIAYSIFFYLALFRKKNILFKIILIIFFLLIYRKIFKDNSIINFNIINYLILFFQGVIIFFIKNKFKNQNYFLFLGIALLSLSLIGNFKIFLFFPGILIIFLFMEKFLNHSLKTIFDFLGSLTYSIYLWHVPLQIIIILIAKNDISSLSELQNIIFFIFYILFVLTVSIISFFFFESPVRKLIRNKFI